MAYSSGSIFSSIAMSWNSLDSKISGHSTDSTDSQYCWRATICTLGGVQGVEAGLAEVTGVAGCGEGGEPGLLGTVLITSSRRRITHRSKRRISAHCTPAISG